ncbi:nucleotide exchange factor GrpE [Microbacterium hominis]|uniref:Protein GrpE n=1 Tax=Microbacterium hominis TaxID=162426 RepID=A0A2K9DUL8_9MICO|nr:MULTISPECIES: nucleotide exchange factor GrpE [Microbacterium]AUG28323.1 nucleotide exchange factor GrpE [Microbacterium hominis]QOC27031.1 nucleotide exchange factor GrpE [Microbacterium hominis]QOC28192.1 nucleotide exchange factor GrpE [Microbacterium hominis]QRY39823.1 nucleotide exchange factor GrpE [Microbacterium hominis]QYF96633.1 nucleotide exchange factor GrpE [Microbacterium sp. PAMC21962]
MTNKDFEEPIDEVPGDEGSEAHASGPDSQGAADDGDALTVDDILDTAQTDEAAVAEASPEDRDLLLDLKRVQAEYANYRRRTEEQREVEIARAKGSVAKGLLPVLDDLDRAEKHGDLVEGSPLLAIAEKLRAVVARLGVETYGVAGEAFDPQQHEAIFHAPNPGGVEDGTILDVVEVGYRLGTIELRPAKVVVAGSAD